MSNLNYQQLLSKNQKPRIFSLHLAMDPLFLLHLCFSQSLFMSILTPNAFNFSSIFLLFTLNPNLKSFHEIIHCFSRSFPSKNRIFTWFKSKKLHCFESTERTKVLLTLKNSYSDSAYHVDEPHIFEFVK